ncbi:MAG: TonB-dependent receptor plug, partial [Bryobacterales bacterium]|nr:TonB-dependent receptor plug [Bryobacterales bacterium]
MTNVHVALRAIFLRFPILPLLIASVSWGQVTTATFYGIVTDPGGAVIPGAAVTLTQADTGAVITTNTDPAGEFTFDFLKAATYDLRIEAQGFKLRSTKGIELSASQKFRGTFGMELGSVSETVTIEGQSTQLNTVSAEQRQTIGRQELTELPVAQRSFDNLLSLGTGVQLSSTGGLRLNGIGRSGVKITVDGTDGSSNPENAGTGLKNNFNIIHTLSMEAIEEVETTKGVTPAEYGQQLSGNVNLTTKSGSNT